MQKTGEGCKIADIEVNFYHLGLRYREPFFYDQDDLPDALAITQELPIIESTPAPVVTENREGTMPRTILRLAGAAAILGLGVIGVKHVGDKLADLNNNNSDPAVTMPHISDKLPVPVEEDVNSAVRVTAYPSGRSVYSGWYGSGERIAGGDIITAGHVFYNKKNKLIRGMDNCGNVTIKSVGREQIAALRQTGSLGNDVHGDIPDIAIVQPSKLINNKFNKTVPIANKPETVGQTVYFINNEPVSDQAKSADRDPYYQNVPQPAIFAGVIAHIQTNGSYDVVTGFQGFGTKPISDELIGGGSGGQLVNAKGDLIGISDAVFLKVHTVEQADDRMGLNLKNINPQTKLQIDYVQPVNKEIVADLKHRLSTLPDNC